MRLNQDRNQTHANASHARGLIFDDTFDNAATAIAQNLQNTGLEASIRISKELGDCSQRLQASVDQLGKDLKESASHAGFLAAREIARGLKHSVFLICASSLLMRLFVRK